MDSMADLLYGFKIFENWHCKFPFEGLSIEDYQQKIMLSEPRINQLSKRINLEGKTVLELGCLEGVHSLMLQNLGVKKVVGIEGRKENFLKCLIVKNAFNLNRCKFLFGDLNKILSVLSGPFDICLALGVLYHLEDPLSAIYRIAELTNRLFVWSHYSTKDEPKGPLIEVEYQGNICHGKYVGEDIKHYLSGLNKKSFWIFEDDFLKVVEKTGFKYIDLIQKEKHEHGPAMTFLAQK